MCIAIFKKAGKIIDEKIFRNCFQNNDDGAGFAVVEKDENGKDELNIYKGIFSIEKFLEVFEPYKEKQCLIHFRIATHKYVNGENCHPWRVNDNLVFIHNGVISNINKNVEISDTGNFAHEILEPLAKVDPDFWQRPEFKWFLENSIGSGNKLVLMNTKGEFTIINEKAGEWEDGIWYSNTSFKYRKWHTGSVYGGASSNNSSSNESENTTEGNFSLDQVATSRNSDEIEEMADRMSDAADAAANEETITYDLDEIDTILEQEQKKAQKSLALT